MRVVSLMLVVALVAHVSAVTVREASQDMPPEDECKLFETASGSTTDGSDAKHNYKNNENKCWYITPEMEDGQELSLHFNRFDVEEGYDFLKIYDFEQGKWVSAEAKAGSKFISKDSDGGFYLWFTTDESETMYGWEVEWAVSGGEHEEEEEDEEDVVPESVVFDFHTDENGREAKTSRYKMDGSLVTRRGAEFKFTIQGVKPTEFKFTLQGDSATDTTRPGGSETKHGFKVSSAEEASGWLGGTKEYTVTVTIAADAPVGQWDVKVKGGRKWYGNDRSVFVAFNPYNREDTSYVADAHILKEYLEKDDGYAYYGSSNSWGRMAWGYDQYKANNYRTVFAIMEGLGAEKRRSPIYVSRWMSWVGNDKLLHGRWDGEYDDGKQPGYWKDTTSILDVYRATGRPVKYGQCWVFSSLLNTLLRGVGLASRGITNFDSAHEHPVRGVFDQKIDQYYEKRADGYIYRKKDQPTDDSVWNFHVWNEVRFARPDVKVDGFDGSKPVWNQVDATCQEESDGKCQMGPNPIPAQKLASQQVFSERVETLKDVKYDGPFGQSETNAERYMWLETSKDKYRPWAIDTQAIGKLSLTHDGSRHVERQNAYKQEHFKKRIYAKEVGGKFEWPSDDEAFPAYSGGRFAEVSNKALAGSRMEVGKDQKDDVVFSAEMIGKPSSMKMGKDLTFKMKMKVHPKDWTANKKEESKSKNNKARMNAGKRTVKWTLRVVAISYKGNKDFGVAGQTLKATTVLTTRAGKEEPLTVSEDEYMKFLKDTDTFRAEFTAYVEETGQFWGEEIVQSLAAPAIITQQQDLEVAAGDRAEVTFQFGNPFNKPLKKCAFQGSISGGGQLNEVQKVQDMVEPHRDMQLRLSAKASEVGDRQALVRLECDGLPAFVGSADIKVTKRTKEAVVPDKKPSLWDKIKKWSKGIFSKVKSWFSKEDDEEEEETGPTKPEKQEEEKEEKKKEQEQEEEQQREQEEEEPEKQEEPAEEQQLVDKSTTPKKKRRRPR